MTLSCNRHVRCAPRSLHGHNQVFQDSPRPNDIRGGTEESALFSGYINGHQLLRQLDVVLVTLTPPTLISRNSTRAEMKFATWSSVPLFALSGLTAAVQIEDVLHSKRIVKRGIDAEGNYNICKLSCMTSEIICTHATQLSSISTTSMPISMSSAPLGPTACAQSEAATEGTLASRLFSRNDA
jgi:hypothetical protein